MRGKLLLLICCLFFNSLFNQLDGQVITTVAGTGILGNTGDNGPATAGKIEGPLGIAADFNGNIYFTSLSYTVRKIDGSGTITTFAGTGATSGPLGDGGPATAAVIGPSPWRIATDAAGNVYITDGYNSLIRKVTPAGIITSFAGTGIGGTSGDGGPATAANILEPYAIAADGSGNVYFTQHYCVRKINTSGIITTVVGNGSTGYTGDGGPATNAGVKNLTAIAIDLLGNLYIADEWYSTVRKINTAGIITTIAGTGTAGYNGDGIAATAAQLSYPHGLAADAVGNVYISEWANNRCRKIDTAGTITTVAGTGIGTFGGDGGVATAAKINSPEGIAVDDSGNIFIADFSNSRIRKIYKNNAPYFTKGASQLFTICENGGTKSIDSLLAIADIDTGQNEVWSMVTGPVHGSATVSYTKLSNGDTIVPTGLSYTPTAAYSGNDSFKVRITDGVAADTITIYVSVTRIYNISGSKSLCLGQTATLTDTAGIGTWTSSKTSVATIGSSSGIVSAIAFGTATITYTSGSGCSVTATATVTAGASPITGVFSVCSGATTALTDAGGGTWSSSNTGIATAGTTGIITGVAIGSAAITYTLPSGCIATATVTVSTAPTAITGMAPVCPGLTISLTDAVGGGTWASSNIAKATVNSSGIVTGIASGTANITYSLGGGCTVTAAISVNPAPNAITGAGSVCEGSITVLSDATAGGTWSSTDATVSVGPTTGAVTGINAGTATITYTATGTGCIATKVITVNPLPAAITGPGSVCLGYTIALSSSPGGTWTSGSPVIAPVGASSGIVIGATPGITVVTYAYGTGCKVTTTITANPVPVPITGSVSVCTGTATALTDRTPGGGWYCGGSCATISSTGIVTGITTGTATISYVMITTGCMATMAITVNALPAPISGAGGVCAGAATTLSDAGGGTWTSAATSTATIGLTSGIAIGVAAGTTSITYTAGTGCIATTVMTVDPIPGPITGSTIVCGSLTTTLSDSTPGGVWSSGSPAIAAITPGTGIVTGGAGGTAIITYTIGAGCIITKAITVNPAAKAITGVADMCAGGSTMTVYNADAPAGTWTCSLVTITSAGFVTAYTTGTAGITYTLPTGCFTTASFTVHPLPALITGAAFACTGQAAALSDSTAGGVWRSATTTVATISGTGIVTGITAGTTIISYQLLTGCMVTDTLSVQVSPSVITGIANVCMGATTTLSDSLSGGAWSTASGGIAGIGTGSGIVTGVAVGTAAITYTSAGGCAATQTVTVLPLPVVFGVSGGGSFCAGDTGVHVMLSGSTTGTNYDLYDGPTLAGTMPGAGIFMDFGRETGGGIYTVVATDAVTGCSNNMSGSATIIVNPLLTPVVSIAADPGIKVCEGTAVSFTTTTTNGGSLPVYQWKVNSVISGSSIATYTYTPVDGDVVVVMLTSNATCASPKEAYGFVTMEVVAPVAPAVTLTADPSATISKGQAVTFMATVTNGLPSLTYQWQLNNTDIPGETNNTYTTTSLANNDKVSCVVTSNDVCVTATTEEVQMNVSSTGIGLITSANSGLRVIPNPNTGDFTIKGTLSAAIDENVSVELTDMLGQTVYKSSVPAKNGMIDEQVRLKNTLANGMYLLHVHSGTAHIVFHIVIDQ